MRRRAVSVILMIANTKNLFNFDQLLNITLIVLTANLESRHTIYNALCYGAGRYKPDAMYKVLFQGEDFAKGLSLEDSLGLALSLHRASTVKHTVSVMDTVDNVTVISLTNERDLQS